MTFCTVCLTKEGAEDERKRLVRAQELCVWLFKLKDMERHHIRPAVLHFNNDRYGVTTPTKLEYLEAADVEEILKDLPLVPRKIISAAIRKKHSDWWPGWGMGLLLLIVTCGLYFKSA